MARAGVLIKDAEALQGMDTVDTLVIDKTGTLTEGRPALIAVEIAQGFARNEILAAAAAVEARSEHPLARAVVTGARDEGLEAVSVDDFESQTGFGVSGRIDGRDVAVGNSAQMERVGANVSALTNVADRYRAEGARAKGAKVVMAGDGINDAPALAAADVGVAMGTGTDVAIESAGMTLTKGDLETMVRARRLAKATMRNIRQNLFFSFLFNGIGVPVAAGVRYPVAGILLSPMIAGAAMALSSFTVVTNALRLNAVKL